MGRTKLGVTLAGVIVMLLGVVAVVAMQSNGGSTNANSVVSSTSDQATVEAAPAVEPAAPASSPVTAQGPKAQATGTTPTTKAPAKAPAAITPTTLSPQPSVQEIQQIIAGLTTQIQSQAANGPTPLTTEQVEAQLRATLKQLGITY